MISIVFLYLKTKAKPPVTIYHFLMDRANPRRSARLAQRARDHAAPVEDSESREEVPEQAPPSVFPILPPIQVPQAPQDPQDAFPDHLRDLTPMQTGTDTPFDPDFVPNLSPTEPSTLYSDSSLVEIRLSNPTPDAMPIPRQDRFFQLEWTGPTAEDEEYSPLLHVPIASVYIGPYLQPITTRLEPLAQSCTMSFAVYGMLFSTPNPHSRLVTVPRTRHIPHFPPMEVISEVDTVITMGNRNETLTFEVCWSGQLVLGSTFYQKFNLFCHGGERAVFSEDFRIMVANTFVSRPIEYGPI